MVHKILHREIHTQTSFIKKYQVQKFKFGILVIIHTTRSNYEKQNILYEDVKIYNNLLNTVKNLKSLRTFKTLQKIISLKTFKLLLSFSTFISCEIISNHIFMCVNVIFMFV